MSKRTLDAFFSAPTKRAKADHSASLRPVSPLPKSGGYDHRSDRATDVITDHIQAMDTGSTLHETYPFPIANLPTEIFQQLEKLVLTASGKEIKNQPHLDLLYFQPLIRQPTADQLFRFLRASLPFYRVKYTVTRFGKPVDVNTPRYTTVYGVDETSRFITESRTDPNAADITKLLTTLVETHGTAKEGSPGKYKSCVVPPRPIPPCLAILKGLAEALTGDTYNFVLVNYYSNGQDSISFHSDDERFLTTNPAIASFSLGARRDFLMKHKPPGPGPSFGNKGHVKPDAFTDGKTYPGTTPIKLPLASGDMILMRGETQRNWLHSIPKRSDKNSDADKGRINITMRKVMIPAGTENYYQYNVGSGPVYRWDERREEMVSRA